VAVDRADPDPRAFGDILDFCVYAQVRERLPRPREHLPAVGDRIGAAALL
jgi:hypothetical protein